MPLFSPKGESPSKSFMEIQTSNRFPPRRIMHLLYVLSFLQTSGHRPILHLVPLLICVPRLHHTHASSLLTFFRQHSPCASLDFSRDTFQPTAPSCIFSNTRIASHTRRAPLSARRLNPQPRSFPNCHARVRKRRLVRSTAILLNRTRSCFGVSGAEEDGAHRHNANTPEPTTHAQ